MKKTFTYKIEIEGEIITEDNNYFVDSELKHKLDDLYEESLLEDISAKIMSDMIQTESHIIIPDVDKTITFKPEQIKINKI